MIGFFSPHRILWDFDNYYRTVADIRTGHNPYTISYMQTLGPPLVFQYYLPFNLVSLPTAQVFFLSMQLVAGYFTCLLLSLRFFRRPYYASLLLFTLLCLSFLTRYSLQIGQPVLTLGLLITILLLTSSPLIKSFTLAALMSIKSFFAITLSAFLFRPISILTACLTVVVITLGGMSLIRPEWYLYYTTHKFLPNVTAAEYDGRLNYENQTLKSTLTRLHIQPLYPVVWILAAIYLIRNSSSTRNLPLGILSSFILSPVLWQHYFAALFSLFIYRAMTATSHRHILLSGIAILLWWPDLSWLHSAPPTLFNGFLASHFFFSLLLLTASFVESAPAPSTFPLRFPLRFSPAHP